LDSDPRTRPLPTTRLDDLMVSPPPGRTPDPASDPAADRSRHPVEKLVLVTVASGSSAWLVGRAVQSVAGDRNAPWIIGRASGVTSYLLLVVLVILGLGLSHPWRIRWHRPSAATRIRLHISLAMFTLAFVVLHVVVLATDKYAKVGWWGSVLPMASQYRPVAVTLGVIGAYAGLVAGLTAAFAGRWARRVWWPVHKVAGVSLVLVGLHGILAGADTPLLRWMYLGTAGLVVVLAITRYAARTPGDRVRELLETRGGRG
jgi:Ferric reductase like transmembrane component